MTGVAMFVVLFIIATAAVTTYQVVNDTRASDIGDIFEKSARVAEYADERLEAAAGGRELPKPPELLADQPTLQLALAMTLVTQALTLGIVGVSTRLTFGELRRALGLERYAFRSAWRPALAVFGAYTMVVVYAMVAEAIGIGLLEPESTVPFEITRDHLTLSIAAAVTLVGAPFSEELLFRGLVFSGLLRWGFWPAAVVSSFSFTLLHLDPGSLIPFSLIGILIAWLYWSRGTLWDSIIFHFLFNATSFTFLVWGT
ncbi:MAG: CPBP family intramembrane metalloprotease [Dehalococcoidia bacterium]|nr:MAG: CPBP family intramembrane metalloprotease [bacterium]MCE7928507.1 CPBP family intramembrane metalloprotease [Chloroflexi bacterium CFX7]MCK6564402.1 CPBP family intramembrane metalloprotease [Dehalococcoidia bacterium]MCL4231826.1 CPBP family intramembrane metalloprotease [Dehalococcoidia bacterium]NUQ54310.1 CPBP family intramembrane metalloprotease [Dehalococcoidia bacterium]